MPFFKALPKKKMGLKINRLMGKWDGGFLEALEELAQQRRVGHVSSLVWPPSVARCGPATDQSSRTNCQSHGEVQKRWASIQLPRLPEAAQASPPWNHICAHLAPTSGICGGLRSSRAFLPQDPIRKVDTPQTGARAPSPASAGSHTASIWGD